MGDRRHDWPRPTAPRSLGNCSDLGDRSNAWHWYEHRPHSRHWYENDVTRPPFVITAPQFVIPAKAGIQRGRVAPTTPKHFQRPGLIFIPWCAGDSRHERLVRKWMFPATPARISCRGDSRIALGGVVVPAHPGIPRTRHWYENDATQPQKCLNATAPALVSPAPGLVSPAPQSSFRRKPESRGGTNDTQDTSTNQRSPIFKP